MENGELWPVSRADMQAQRDRGFEFANGIELTLTYDIGDAVHAE